MKRRDILKSIAVLPFASGVAKSVAAPVENELAGPVGSLVPGPKIYQSIGVEPVINCRGTFTIIGASVELPEVREAMEFACQYYVQLDAAGNGRRKKTIRNYRCGMGHGIGWLCSWNKTRNSGLCRRR